MFRVARLILLASLTTGLFAGSASAQNRFFVGARNLGMGGTGVATAVHYNPAGMAFNHGWDVQFPLVTVDASVGGDLFEQIDELNDVFDARSLDEIQSRFDSGTGTIQDLTSVLDAFLYELPDLSLNRSGGNARAISSPAFRWNNWGFSVGILGNGGVDSVIDLQNGLSFGGLGFAGAIPNPTPNACGGDPICLNLAADLMTASGGQLDQDRAETIVNAAGPELAGDPEAQQILTRIVVATANGDSSLANNQSAVLTSTIAAVQFTGTYSHMVYQNKLSVGGSLRVLQGRVDRVVTRATSVESGEETFDDLVDTINDHDGATSTEIAIDLGVMYRPAPKWSLGLVGASLNGPSFDLASGQKFEINPSVKLGGAYGPVKWFNVELNLDLNEVDSQVVRGFGYRYVNLGAEFLAGRWFSGWIGGYRNLALDGSEPNYTLGLGFRAGRFQIGLSGALSSEDVQLSTGEDNDTFPNGAAAAITLAWQPKRQG